jgi:hypothetical protein
MSRRTFALPHGTLHLDCKLFQEELIGFLGIRERSVELKKSGINS